jgi:hypothetical protein
MFRSYVAKKLAANRQRDAYSRLQQVGGDMVATLEQYLKESKSTGCSHADYWLLYCAIRKYRPQEVLECGTGASTLVIAHALQENGSGRVTSMEESSDWYDMADKLLPEKYRPVVDLRLSETIEDGHAMFRGLRYRDVPDLPYDFVFIDGPEKAHGVTQRESADFDLIHILRKTTQPVRAIVDSRTGTFWTLARILGRDKVRFSYLLRHGLILPSTKSDLRNARTIIEDDFRWHRFRRIPRAEYRA